MFEGCKEHLVIENVLSTGSKIWESVKQAQKEQNVLVDGFALLLLPSFNNERRMTRSEIFQSAKDDLSMQAIGQMSTASAVRHPHGFAC